MKSERIGLKSPDLNRKPTWHDLKVVVNTVKKPNGSSYTFDYFVWEKTGFSYASFVLEPRGRFFVIDLFSPLDFNTSLIRSKTYLGTAALLATLHGAKHDMPECALESHVRASGGLSPMFEDYLQARELDFIHGTPFPEVYEIISGFAMSKGIDPDILAGNITYNRLPSR